MVLKAVNQQQEVKMFFGGLPTDIEVAKLREAYPEADMEPGDFFPYSDIGKLLGLDWRESRFRTVTLRWRRIVQKETNIVLEPVPGVGIKMLTEAEKIVKAGKKIRSAGAAAKEAFDIGSRVDRKPLLDHLLGTAAKMHSAAQIKRKLQLPEM